MNFISETPNDKAERESRAGREEVEERFQEELQDVINRRKGLEYRYRSAHHVLNVLFCDVVYHRTNHFEMPEP